MSTRRLPVVHAIPTFASGAHRASTSCPCHPTEAGDLLEPGRRVVVHQRLTGGDMAPVTVLPDSDCPCCLAVGAAVDQVLVARRELRRTSRECDAHHGLDRLAHGPDDEADDDRDWRQVPLLVSRGET